MSSPVSWTAQLRRLHLGTVLWSLGAVLLFVPWTPLAWRAADLGQLRPDYAFMMAQVEIHSQGAQFGADLIWTYGPLGFVLFDLSWVDPNLLVWVVWFRVLLALVFAWGVSRLLRYRTRSLPATLLLGSGIVVLCLVNSDGRHSAYWLAFPLLAAWFALRDRAPPRGLIAALTVAAAAVSCCKGTHLLFGVTAFGLLAVWDLVGRRRPPWTSLLFAVALLLSWQLAGQDWRNLWAYLMWTLELGSGYGEAMAKGFVAPYAFADVVLGFVAAAVPVLALPFVLSADGTRSRSMGRKNVWLTTALVAALAMLSSKHAWGGNQLGNAASAWLLGVLLAASSIDGGRHRLVAVALAVAAACCGTLWLRNDSGVTAVLSDPIDSVWRHRAKPKDMLCAPFGGLDGHRSVHDETVLRVRSLAALPFGLEGTIDCIGDLPAIASSHPTLRYTPRPMYLSLNAHTEAVAAWNADFLRGPNAPDYLVLDLCSLPGQYPYDRYPTLSDGPLWLPMLARYDQVGMVADRPLLHRRPIAAAIRMSPPTTRELRWGEWLEVQPDAGLTWMSLDVGRLPLGSVVEALYKLPIVAMEVELEGGRTQSYRIVPRMARAGFLLTPFVGDGWDYAQLLRAMRAGRSLAGLAAVRRLRLMQGDGPESLRASSIQVSLSRLEFESPATVPPATVPPATVPPTTERWQRLVDLRAGMEESLFPPAHRELDGKPVVMAHAPARARLEVPEGARRLELHFGVLDSAFNSGDGGTDGVQFRVRAVGSANELWSRLLEPATRSGDRGEQRATIEIPEGVSGLLLDALPGPRGDIAFDHSYWSDARFR